MKKTVLPFALVFALAVPALASAQATVELRLGLPIVLPQLVVVSPGVQVVPDVDQEVFFVDGFYWVRHDGGWYRSRSHRGGWVLVPGRAVPGRIVSIPPGKYRRWKPARAERRDDRDRWYGDGDRHGKHGKKGRGHGRD